MAEPATLARRARRRSRRQRPGPRRGRRSPRRPAGFFARGRGAAAPARGDRPREEILARPPRPLAIPDRGNRRSGSTEAQEELARLAEAPDEFLAAAARAGAKNRRRPNSAVKAPPTPAPWRETDLAEAERAARAALEAMSAAREIRARLEAQAEAARHRLQILLRDIAKQLECPPQGLPALAGVAEGEIFPPMDRVQRAARQPETGSRAARRRQSARRGRVGDGRGRTGQTGAEQADLAEAIRKLRTAIGSAQQGGARAPARRLRTR